MSDVIPWSWWFSWWLSHQIRATESYYCGDGPCVAACSICCFFAHFDLGPSFNFLMDSWSFPQLLQSFFLCFCFISLLLSVGWCFTCFVSLLCFSSRYFELQFSFPPADTCNFVFSIWGFAFVAFLLSLVPFAYCWVSDGALLASFPCFVFHAGILSCSLVFLLLTRVILCSPYEVFLLLPSC